MDDIKIEIQKLYQKFLERDADNTGLESFLNRHKEGMKLEEIADEIRLSNEAQMYRMKKFQDLSTDFSSSLSNKEIEKIIEENKPWYHWAKINGIEKDFRSLAMEEKKLWAFNREIGNYEKSLFQIKRNEVLVIDLWNDTRWPHSMHLHGHHFFVKSKEFKNVNDYLLRDTYLMQAGEKTKLIVVVDNLGKWLFHCHMLEHAASGMVAYIEVI